MVKGCAIGCLAVVVIAIVAVVSLFYSDHNPQTLFRRLVVDPQPTSATIIDSECRDLVFAGEQAWLHFRIAPADLDQILSLQEFRTGETPKNGSSAPPWWKPMGTYYESGSVAERHARGMYVSDDRSEVYLVSVFF